MAKHADNVYSLSILEEIVEMMEVALDSAFVKGIEAERENKSTGGFGVSRDYFWGVLQGKEDERERIVAMLSNDCNHAEPRCWHRDAINLIRGNPQKVVVKSAEGLNNE